MNENVRISVSYGGLEYFLQHSDLTKVEEQIAGAVTSQEPEWLDVSVGQGRSTSARLLLGPGIPIAVWAVNTDGDRAPRDDDNINVDQYDDTGA